MVYDIDTHALFLAFSFSLSFRTFRYRQFLFSKAQALSNIILAEIMPRRGNRLTRKSNRRAIYADD